MTDERKVHVCVMPSPPLPALALGMFVQAATGGSLTFRCRLGYDEGDVIVDDKEHDKSYCIRNYWELAAMSCLDPDAVQPAFPRLASMIDAAVRGDYEEVRWQLKQALQDYYLHCKQREDKDDDV